MEGFQVTDAILIAVIIGLIEGAKIVFNMPKRLAPVVALVLGIVGGVVYIFPGDLKMGVLVGIVMGLTSVGLYSGTKTTAKAANKTKDE